MTKLTVSGIFVGGLLALGYAVAPWVPVREPSRSVDSPISAREPGVVKFEADSPQLVAIKTLAVEEAPLPLAEPLSTRIVYDENRTARVSSSIAGRVVRLLASPGDTVRAGDVLAVLDSPDLAAAVADLRKAVAEEGRKRLALDRAKTLFDGGVLPQKEFENAEADFEQAAAETRRAQLRLRTLGPSPEVGDNGYAVRAPIGGIVVDRRVNPGMQVRPDLPDPLFVITDPTHLWAIVDLPERALAKVQPGRPVSVEVDAYPGASFSATIAKVGEVVDPVTRRVPVRCTLPNTDRRLKPEMYARTTLLAESGERALRVPNHALVTAGLFSFAFVERSPGVFQRRKVGLAFQDPESSYVATGLSPGERVVVAGALLLNAEFAEAAQ